MIKRITKKSILVASLSVGIALFAVEGYSQQGMPMQKPNQQTQSADYSDEDIEKFVEGNKVVQTIQQEKRPEMMGVIEKQEGIDMQTFNKIAQAQQNPQGGSGDFSESEMAAFEKASQKLMQKQEEMQQEMAERLPEEVGISMEKFQEMMMAYRQNPEFQKQVQAKMEN